MIAFLTALFAVRVTPVITIGITDHVPLFVIGNLARVRLNGQYDGKDKAGRKIQKESSFNRSFPRSLVPFFLVRPRILYLE